MNVSEMMRTQVVTISPEAGLDRALVMMRTQRIRHLPVVEQGDLVGIISDRDLRISMVEAQGPRDAPKGLYLPTLTKVRAIMKEKVLTVKATDSVEVAAKLMSENKVGGLPVVAEDGRKVLGIVTETDMLRLLVKILADKGA